jgi:chromosomal replication initiation ATPase DnaA
MSLVESRSALRNRLMNPPNGRKSNDTEIISEGERYRRERSAALIVAKRAEYTARWNAKAEAIEEKRRLHQKAKEERDEWIRQHEDWIKGLNANTIQIRTIIDYCCRKYNVRRERILGPIREAKPTRVRHIIVYLCFELTTRSSTEIGMCIGQRDHTTVLHARRRITRQIAADPVFAAEVAEVRAAIEARHD